MAITNSPLNHGMGSRLLKALCVMGWAIDKNIEYLHTPFGRPVGQANMKVNHLKYYSPEKIPNGELRSRFLEMCSRWDRMLGWRGEFSDDKTPYLVFPPDPGYEEATRKNKDVILGWFNIPEVIFPAKTAVVHIRRHDVNAGQNQDRFVPDDYYFGAIKDLISDYSVEIHTQRLNFFAEPYLELGCTIIYDDEILDNESWLRMLRAPLLIMGNSSFSYSAGLLHGGEVIALPHSVCGPKVSGWL